MANDKAKRKAAKKVEKAVRKALKKGLTEKAVEEAVGLGLTEASDKRKAVGKAEAAEDAQAAKRA
jgi:Ribonuclease G/E